MDSGTTNLYLFAILVLMLIILALQKRTNQKYYYLITIVFFALFTLANIVVYTHKFRATSNEIRKLSLKREPRLFCIIFTAPKKFGEQRPFTVLNVWATKCDNYRFVTVMPNGTNFTRTKSESLEIGEPFNIMQPRGFVKENYWKLTNKVFLTFKQVYEEFGDYDWYLKGNKFYLDRSK